MSTVLDSLATETLRALVEARGPLTIDDVRHKIGERHGGYLPYAQVYARASRLVLLDLAETRADALPGIAFRTRIFWPTPSGRSIITARPEGAA